MDKYGIDNVRGGSYATIKLDEFTRKHLERISRATNNKCSTKYSNVLREEEIKAQQIEIQEILAMELDVIQPEELRVISQEKLQWEIKYQEDLRLEELQRKEKIKRQTIIKDTQRQVSIQIQESRRKQQSNICSRCEKKGHYTSNCHETKDIRGRAIDDFCVIS